MCEYAWTNFDMVSKEYIGLSHEKDRIHATQKPVNLYEWLLSRFANEGDIILDTHVGSGSSLIACINQGFKYVGFEIDEYYYNTAKERIENNTGEINKSNIIKGQICIFDYKEISEV